jgi:hypothetical protein
LKAVSLRRNLSSRSNRRPSEPANIRKAGSTRTLARAGTSPVVACKILLCDCETHHVVSTGLLDD